MVVATSAEEAQALYTIKQQIVVAAAADARPTVLWVNISVCLFCGSTFQYACELGTLPLHSLLLCEPICCTAQYAILCCAVLSCVACVLQRLDLQRGGNKRYQKTAAYGHFGRNHDPDFTWEQVVPLS
jgi:hypothetical protein